MAVDIVLADFIGGEYNIPSASTRIASANTEVQACITKHRAKYVYKLLGIELGALIIAYNGTGNTDYDRIIAAFADPDHGQSFGLKEYLKACIYYEYTKNSYVETLAGTAEPNAEVSKKVSAPSTMRKAEKAFNGILDTADAIQSVCRSNSVAYAGYCGQRIVVKAHQAFI